MSDSELKIRFGGLYVQLWIDELKCLGNSDSKLKRKAMNMPEM